MHRRRGRQPDPSGVRRAGLTASAAARMHERARPRTAAGGLIRAHPGRRCAHGTAGFRAGAPAGDWPARPQRRGRRQDPAGTTGATPAAFDTTGRSCRRIPAADLATRARGRSARWQGPPDPPWELLKGMSAACLLLARTGKRRPLREGARTPLPLPSAFLHWARADAEIKGGHSCSATAGRVILARAPRSNPKTAPRRRSARRQPPTARAPGDSDGHAQPAPPGHARLCAAFRRGARPAPGQGKARCTSTAAQARVTATATTTTTAEKATALASQLRVCVALPAPCAATPKRGRLSARP